MASDPKSPKVGDLAIDMTDFEGVLVDLPPGAMVGFRRNRDGIDEVVAEVIGNQPTYGARAGIQTEAFNDFCALNEQISRLKAFVAPLEKLLEMTRETQGQLEDRLDTRVRQFAGTVDVMAKTQNDSDLLARYEKLREYRSAVAVKAAKTRKANEASEDGTV